MLKNYLKIAFKVFLRRKFFTFISLFGIALTLIVLVVAVALWDHVFGPQPPETYADRLITLYFVHARGPQGASTNGPAGYMFHDRYVRTLKEPERISVHGIFLPTISYRNSAAIKSWLKNVDGEFWNVFRFNFLEGTPFTSQDEKNGNRVAVINETTRRRFFGNASAVGQIIELDRQNFRVVGVVSDVPMLRFTSFADAWVPISTRKSMQYKTEFENGMFFSTILAKSPADIPKIQEEFKGMLTRIEYPDPKYINQLRGQPNTLLRTVSEELAQGYLTTAILVAMILFMCLPTINLININVSRIRERSSEIGVRKAFGASSLTLVGQFVVENVVLTLLGGVLAFGGSQLVLRAINQSDWIPYAQLTLNLRIFLYGLLIAVFFGLFSGVYPAWKMSRLHPVEALRGRES
jgi:putative ABC transport system permease protein